MTAVTTAEPLPSGRRARKKRETRERIGQVAMALFLERGFERTTVAQVAEAADVSLQTVFNHFPTKEDLVFSDLAEWEDSVLEAMRERPSGRDVVEAYRDALFSRGGLLAEPGATARDRLVRINAMIGSSPALTRREDELQRRRTDELAEILGANGPLGAVGSWVVANALVGVHRALVALVRRGLADGIPSAELARTAAREGHAALDLLARGLSSATSATSAPPEEEGPR